MALIAKYADTSVFSHSGDHNVFRTTDRIDPTRVCGPLLSSWVRRIRAAFCKPILDITIRSEHIGH